ncbi:MAG: hypothetical protein ACUVS8_13970, partial [Armatimonadota bacterium]
DVGGALAGLSLRRLEEEPEVPAGGEGEPPVGSPPAVGTIAWAKTRPDGTQVSLYGKVVTAVFPDAAPPCLYIQEPDRASGIRVVPEHFGGVWPVRGNTVNVVDYEVLTDADGERYLVAPGAGGRFPSVGVVPTAVPVSPLTVTTRAVWCGPLGGEATGACVDGVEGSGLHLIGLFVRLAGVVSYVDPSGEFFCVSDGAARPGVVADIPVTDRDGNPGIRVLTDDWVPQTGSQVTVVGVAGLERDVACDDIYPVIRALPCESLRLSTPVVFVPQCQGTTSVYAVVDLCGDTAREVPVEFGIHFADGYFLESGQQTATVLADSSGRATATLVQTSGGWSPFVTATAGGSQVSTPLVVAGSSWQCNAEITCEPFWALAGNQVEVVARCTTGSGETWRGLPGQLVTLTCSGGAFFNGAQSLTALSDNNGEVRAVLAVGSQCPSQITVAMSYVDPCNIVRADAAQVDVYCDGSAVRDLWLCIDVTGSMQWIWAVPSMVKLVRDLDSARIPLRLGGVKFNDENLIRPDQVRSLAQFRSVRRFIEEYLDQWYEGNSHSSVQELQLDALMLAANDLAANAAPGNTQNRFVALVTDAAYHYLDDPYGGTERSSLTKAGVTQTLELSGAHVHISLWEFDNSLRNAVYDGLNVNDGQFEDPVITYLDEERYPFTLLRQAMGLVQ